MHRTRRTSRVVALTLAMLTPIGAAFAGTGAGAPGIGDPYYPDYGNGGYNVAHYDIDVSYDATSDTVSGTTQIDATATEKLKQLNLDLVLPASKVVINGKPATFTQQTHELVVTPRSTVRRGGELAITVTYAGVPSDYEVNGYNPWIRTSDGAAAVGEPEVAAWWYPSNDHPRDKATFDISVTVPDGQEALSNGVLRSQTVEDGKRTWSWRESKPMATYLAFFVTGQYDITTGTADGRPWVNAVASNGGSEGEYAAADLARTPEVVKWESEQWGPYPFEALGGVAPAADFGFALENQTRPVYTRGFWRRGPNIYVVVHELGHQWYGDSVSVQNWKDIWLNEGFASFTEWLWSEDHGDGTAAQLFDEYWSEYDGNTKFWSLPIGDPGAGKEFSGAVYDRGAMALQALRVRTGDAAFRSTMRSWAAEHRYGNGEISQFIALAEKVSGEDLGSFFDTWLYATTQPTPSAENGFPADFAARRSATPTRSKAKIDHAHRFGR